MKARGFSLLELLVAMAVLGLSLTLLYQVDAGVLRGLGDQDRQQRATLLAQSLLEARDAVPAAGLNEAGEAAGFGWSVVSRALPPPAGLPADAPVLHSVHVAVRWEGRLGPKALDVHTVLPQALPEPGGRSP